MGDVKRPATYADIEALPENMVGEIIDGELIVSPRPRTRHGAAAMGIALALGQRFHQGDGDPGGWWILPEPELHLGPQVVVPDLAGWRRERLPQIPDVVGVTIAPDWISEVLSPSTARVDRLKKLKIYAKHRVGHVWLVDPVLRTLEILRLGDSGWTIVAVHGDDARVRAEPFDAIEIDLARWWLPETQGGRASDPAVEYDPAAP